jgi:hypothetical protein
MRSFNRARFQAVAIFALGVVVGGGFLGGFTQAPEGRMITTSVNTACISGDAVADFVCRNRWMGQHQYSYR